jgi:tetratricopeptide (TPR) repeat protein
VSSGSASIPLFRQAVAQRTPLYSIDWYEDSLAQAWLRLGRYPEAIAEFRRILSIYPRLALTWYGLAQALFAQGDEQQGRQAFAKVAEIWAQADPGLLQRFESRLRPGSAPIANASRLD